MPAPSPARAPSTGPTKPIREKHILTAKDAPFAALQRSGHGDLVETPEGKTYLVHLTGRPTTQERRCVLGRETAIQEAYWGEDDWLYVKNGPVPSLHVDVPGTRDDTAYWAEQRYGFENGLPIDFQWLRTPEPERIFSTDGGKLTLFGRESIGSWFEQALVARRQTHFSYDAETTIDFSPTDERQFAGLTAYYSRYNFFYLTVTAHSDGERELLIMSSRDQLARRQPQIPGRAGEASPHRQGQARSDRPRRRAAILLCPRGRGAAASRSGARCLDPFGRVRRPSGPWQLHRRLRRRRRLRPQWHRAATPTSIISPIARSTIPPTVTRSDP